MQKSTSATSDLMIEIMEDYHSGDPEKVQNSKDKMIEALDGFIGHLIHKHFESFSGEHYPELYQEGVIGILSSMSKYSPEKGKATTFFTAPIIHEMSRYCNMYTNKSSQYHSQIMNTVKKAINHFELKQHEYTTADIILYTGLSAKKVQEALNRINAVNEVYCEDSEAFDKALGKMSDNPEDLVIKQDHDQALVDALKKLEPDQRQAIFMWVGFEGDKASSFAAISRKMRLPVNQVRSLINSALKQLKHDKRLASYYGDRAARKDQSARNTIELFALEDMETLHEAVSDDFSNVEICSKSDGGEDWAEEEFQLKL